MMRKEDFDEGFFEKLNKYIDKSHGDSGCWLWTGGKLPFGYGFTNYKHQTFYAHRIMYLRAAGNIPDGMWILHKCDVRLCCNPDHLYAGTAKQNRADATERKDMRRKLMNPEEWGLSRTPPLSARRIRFLCLRGRIPEASQIGKGRRSMWLIPEGTRIVPVRRGRKKEEDKP